MAKARQQYFADETSIEKESREFAIEASILEKINSIEPGAQVNVIETVKVNWTALTPDENKAVDIDVPLVDDTLYSTSSEDALSARQGRILYDYIQSIQSRWRFLSNWNCVTWLATTNPADNPYQYRTWDYYLVSNVATLGWTNYRPNGSQYVINQASTTVESETVKVWDMYIYDWTYWLLLVNTEREIAVDSSLSTTSTNPVENRVVTNALNWKQDTISDLAAIRAGAALWNTALQPGDSLSQLTWTSDDISEWSTNLFMTTAERSKLSNQSWVNTWDETQTTIKNKLWQASSSTDGYLTSIDWNTFNWKQDAISDLATIRSNASAWKSASDTIATYWDIVTHDVSEFATAAQWGLADTALQPNDNISELTNDVWYVTDAYHDDTKQDKLIAWANIQIAADWKTISSTDTTYTASDFDIKDLADTTGLRAEWSWKQDELIAGTNIQIAADWKTISATDTTYTAGPWISISNNNVISNTNRSAEWWNIIWALSNQTDLQTALNAKQDNLVAGTNIQIAADGKTISATDTTYTAWTWIVIDANNVISNTNVSAEWWNIIWTLSDQTDLQNALNAKQDNLVAGTNIQIAADWKTISATDTTYTASDFDIKDLTDSTSLRSTWSAKQDELIAGTNIQIAADWKTISATDTTYTAWDFDIKDLADSTSLRTTWSGKQDALIAGTNVQIAADGKTISATDTTYSASDFDIKDLADSQDLRTTWSAKQDAISDLQTIRNWAAAWATAVQPWNNITVLTNNAGYITKAVNDLTNYYTKSETYTRTEIDNKIANFAWFEVVAQLPTTDIKTNIIYLLWPVGSAADRYEEYIYSNSNWIMIWETSVDLTNYFNVSTDTSDRITQWSTNLFLTSAERTKLSNTSGTNTGDETKTTIQTKLWAASSSNNWYLTSTDWTTFNNKQEALTAWSNIQIANDWTISATDTTYVASDFDIKDLSDSTSLRNTWSWKQDALVSGTTIKTINSTSILWSWNIDTNQVSDTAYGSSWDWVTDNAPSKNAVYDKISAMDTTISGKQDALATQTAYISKGTASKVPQITTNTLGQVTWITEVDISYPSQIDNTAYSSSWNWVTNKAPTKDAIYDKISAMDTTISGKQDTLTTQTAYTSKWSAIKVPQITTNSLWQVTWITEVTITQPTKTSDLTNDSWYITNAVNNLTNYYKKTETYTQAEVNALVQNFQWFEIVATLPTTEIKTNVIYLLWPTWSGADKYEEYVYSSSTWVKIWDTSVDLTNYFNKTTNTSDNITQWSTNLFVTSSEKSTWSWKQDALTTQTAYTSKWSATKVPQITTNSLWQVTWITEVTIQQPDISGKANISDVLTKTNTTSYTPSADYHPATKKYVDDNTTHIVNISSLSDSTAAWNVLTAIDNYWFENVIVSYGYTDGDDVITRRYLPVSISSNMEAPWIWYYYHSREWNTIYTYNVVNLWPWITPLAYNSSVDIQSALTTQTAYASKWTASKVPQITTNTLWQVTWITEVDVTYPSQVSDTAYASSWNWVTTIAPSKNAVYDKIAAMDTAISWKQDTISDLATIRSWASAWATALQPSAISDTAYASSWDWVTTIAPSKNAVYDKISAMDTTISGKQATLVSGTNIKTINSTSLLWSGNISIAEFNPWSGTTWQVVTKTANWYEWANPSGWDVMVSSQANNILTSWMKIWAWTQANYENLWTYDNNTLYLTIE